MQDIQAALERTNPFQRLLRLRSARPLTGHFEILPCWSAPGAYSLICLALLQM